MKADPSSANLHRELALDLYTSLVVLARTVAREEISSLCGLVLRRLQEWEDTSEVAMLSAIFGEALRDFSSTPDQPGEEST